MLNEERMQKDLQAQIKEQIQRIINGEIESYSSILLPLGDFANYLESIGFTREHFDSNGWEADMWQSMLHPEHGKLTLSTSGYFGGTSVEREEEQDVEEDLPF